MNLTNYYSFCEGCNKFIDSLIREFDVDKFNYLPTKARRSFYELAMKLISIDQHAAGVYDKHAPIEETQTVSDSRDMVRGRPINVNYGDRIMAVRPGEPKPYVRHGQPGRMNIVRHDHEDGDESVYVNVRQDLGSLEPLTTYDELAPVEVEVVEDENTLVDDLIFEARPSPVQMSDREAKNLLDKMREEHKWKQEQEMKKASDEFYKEMSDTFKW